MKEFSQSQFSVFSLIEAAPCDLVTVRNTAKLVSEQRAAKAGGIAAAATKEERKAY